MQMEMDKIAFQLYKILAIPGTRNGMRFKDVVVRKYEIKMRNPGAPGWLSRLKHPTSAQVRISQFMSSSPASGSVFGTCFEFCASLSLCPSPTRTLSLSLKNE